MEELICEAHPRPGRGSNLFRSRAHQSMYILNWKNKHIGVGLLLCEMRARGDTSKNICIFFLKPSRFIFIFLVLLAQYIRIYGWAFFSFFFIVNISSDIQKINYSAYQSLS
jgi:hypothetical protein